MGHYLDMAIDKDALIKWREARGYTKTQFAKDAEISVQYLGDIEKGRSRLERSPDLILRFAQLLNIPHTYLHYRQDGAA